MCAGNSSNQLAGTWPPGGDPGSPADVSSSSSASYRVLRSGRQRPLRSVNREAAGRNVSEPIEPRQILNRVWVSSQYCYGEDHASSLTMVRRLTGVRVDSMLPKRVREPRRSTGVKKESEVRRQEGNFKTVPFPYWKSDSQIVAMNRVMTGERRRLRKLNCVRSILFVHRDEITRKSSRKRHDQAQIGSQESFRELNGMKAQQIYRPVSRELNQFSEEPVAGNPHGGFCEGVTPFERRE